MDLEEEEEFRPPELCDIQTGEMAEMLDLTANNFTIDKEESTIHTEKPKKKKKNTVEKF
jgi:hypothetical protein